MTSVESRRKSEFKRNPFLGGQIDKDCSIVSSIDSIIFTQLLKTDVLKSLQCDKALLRSNVLAMIPVKQLGLGELRIGGKSLFELHEGRGIFDVFFRVLQLFVALKTL